MKKVIIITPTNPLDKHSHSGVVYSIVHELNKSNETIWLKPKITFEGILKNIFPLIFIYILKSLGYTISHHPAISKLYATYLNKQLKSMEYDCIFSFESTYIAYLKTEKPIYYRSDAVYHSMVNYYITNIPNFLIKKGDEVEYNALMNCTNMFVPSQWVINEIQKYYKQVDITKVIFAHSGANMEYLEKMPVKQKDPNCLHLLFIGSDPFRKGIEIAYETTKILNLKYKIKTQLTICGGDIKGLRHMPYIQYVGYINKNIPQQLSLFHNIISQSDIFIFPTKAECAGIVNCEVSAYGLPIIAYDTGGISSYVLNKYNGFTLPITATADDFASIISTLSNDDYKKLSINARKLYEDYYNWEKWGKIANNIINNK